MYAKLFSSITESSLWSDSKDVRILFVAMLAKADAVGFVEASLPGLARIANLTLEETATALEVLKSPDKYSKNPEHEGRRIIEAPGGYILLNYEDYRARRSEEERREYMRDYMKKYRQGVRKLPVNNRKQLLTDVNNRKPPLAAVSHSKPSLAQAEEEAEAEEEITHTHTGPIVPSELEKAWTLWTGFVMERTGDKIGPIEAEAVLMDLMGRGAEKAMRDIMFTIRVCKGEPRRILDSENDFEKQRADKKNAPKIKEIQF